MIKNAVAAVFIVALLGAAVAALSYSGAYNIAADSPHWNITGRVLATVRDRSIAVRADTTPVPNLADPALVALGAEHYADMCTACHLAPGMGDNEMRQGLYPKPPDLTRRRDRSPAESFWIIKHGIRMSAMPAWGVTHDDEAIWGLVAFLQQLPTLDVDTYAALTGPARGTDDDHGATGQDADGPSAAAGATMRTMTEPRHAHVHPDGKGHDY